MRRVTAASRSDLVRPSGSGSRYLRRFKAPKSRTWCESCTSKCHWDSSLLGFSGGCLVFFLVATFSHIQLALYQVLHVSYLCRTATTYHKTIHSNPTATAAERSAALERAATALAAAEDAQGVPERMQ